MRSSRLILLVLGLALLPLPAGAATYLVRPDGSGDYPTIQAAIDAAQQGDVILLADGQFRGPGNRDLNYNGKAIRIRSQSGHAEDCVIDCERASRGVSFISHETALSRLEAVTIANGYLGGEYDCGGAIMCDHGSPSITDCIIRDNEAPTVGALAIFWSSSPIVTRCQFLRNHAAHGGGAAWT